MRIFIGILAFCVLLVAGYTIWGYTGKDYSSLHTTPVSINITGDSGNNGKGNLVCIQPFMTASDYCDQQHFHNVLHTYFKKAQAAGLLQSKTIAVLPENIGSWLAFANEKTRIYQADSMRMAVATIVNSNIFIFIKNLLMTPADDKIKHAFIYMKAALMIKIYTAVFSSLAREFKVTIAAGSIILPQPSVDANGVIRFRTGQLYYSSFIFNPDGKVQAQPVLKVLPEYGSRKRSAASDSNLNVIAQTPAGNIIITADNYSNKSFYYTSEIWKAMAGVFLNGTDKTWDVVWKGPNGFAIPPDAVKKEEDASALQQFNLGYLVSSSIKHSLYNLSKSSIENGFTGHLWEISYENGLHTLHPDSLFVVTKMPVKLQGRIVNIWIR